MRTRKTYAIVTVPRLLALVLVLAGCARVPELAATATADLRDSEYPALIPLDLALEPLPPVAAQAAGLEASLDGRRSRLQARARALQQPVVDDDARERMRAGVTR
jgi:hypothetical protein